MEVVKSMPLFIFSGEINKEELQKYCDMIKFLGGKVLNCNNDQFISSCTHILVFTFCSSVKIMGGLASGKWLVEKEYIIQSYKKRKWVQEEDFEIRNNKNCARFRRLSQRKLYEGLTCFLETNNAIQTKSLVRVLVAGGATIIKRKDVTEKKMKVQLAITNEEYLEFVQSLIGMKTPILDLDYIKKTVFFKQNPNDIKPFLLNTDSAILEDTFDGTIDQKPPRTIRRTKTNRTIASYFTDGNMEYHVKNKRYKQSFNASTSDEIEVIKEVKSDEMEIASNVESEKAVMTSEFQSLKKNKDVRETTLQTKSEDTNLENPKGVEEHNSKSSDSVDKSIHENNWKKLRVTGGAIIAIDTPIMTKLVSSFLKHLNSSNAYLNRFHIPVRANKPVDIKELSLMDSLLYVQTYKDEDLRIVSKKVGRHKMDVLQKVSNEDRDSYENNNFILDALDYMKIRLQRDIVPNSTVVGSMFKHHILRVPFRDAADKALSIFRCLVNLHPPRDRKMRDYYLNVFQNGIPDADTNPKQIRGWNFIRVILEDLMSESDEIKYDAYAALESVIELLELDLVYYNESPVSVTTLLSYRIFWIGKSQTPRIMNEPVKELIQIWINSVKKDSCFSSQVTRLLSIMFELLWKWSDINNPFDLTPWPMHSSFMPLANEFLIRFKDPGSDTLLELVESVRVPWQRLYLASLVYRSKTTESDSEFELSFSILKSKLDKETKLCTEKKDHSKFQKHAFSHETKVQILSLLLISYIYAMGIKYCKSRLLRKFYYSMRTQEVIYHSKEEIEANMAAVQSSEGTTGEKSSEEGDASSDEEIDDAEENSNIKIIIPEIMKMFRELARHIKDLNDMKKVCSHISDINFLNAL